MSGYDSGFDSGYGVTTLVTGMIDLADDIAELIDATVIIDKVAVTPGEPAATDDCSAVYVWGREIFDSPVGVEARGSTAGCLYRRAYEFGYRIDVCYEIHADGTELTTVEYRAVAEDLYGYADDIWCALTAAATDGTLFDTVNVGDCEGIVIGALVFADPQGDRVSATGSILVTDPCSA